MKFLPICSVCSEGLQLPAESEDVVEEVQHQERPAHPKAHHHLHKIYHKFIHQSVLILIHLMPTCLYVFLYEIFSQCLVYEVRLRTDMGCTTLDHCAKNTSTLDHNFVSYTDRADIYVFSAKEHFFKAIL